MEDRVSTPNLTHERQRRSAGFPVVCIGMSSGGLKPLKAIFRHLSSQTGMAFVVVHHIRKIPTLLPEILSTCTDMPVELAVSGQMLWPNRVYVLPSGRDITLSDGFFSLRPNTKNVGFSNVLTLFLQSLATSKHPGVAVILSGVDADGSASLKAFRQRGGIIIAQEPGTADLAEMPEAAILTGVVDHVLPPEEIPPELERIAWQFKNLPRRNEGNC